MLRSDLVQHRESCDSTIASVRAKPQNLKKKTSCQFNRKRINLESQGSWLWRQKFFKNFHPTYLFSPVTSSIKRSAVPHPEASTLQLSSSLLLSSLSSRQQKELVRTAVVPEIYHFAQFANLSLDETAKNVGGANRSIVAVAR